MKKQDIRAEKNALREKFRAKREALSCEEKSERDKSILNKLLSLSEYMHSSEIFTYVSKEKEIDTKRFIEKALQDRKQIFVPRCISGMPIMDFYEIHSLSDLAEGSFGLLEPNPMQCQKIENVSRGLCILPGFCFDKAGYRLGYGKGYYDRFLAKFTGTTVGVCYASDVQNQLPHGYYDRPADILVTEQYIRRVKCSR